MDATHQNRRRWYQFSVRRMFLATACFAVAFSGAAYARVLVFHPQFGDWWQLSLAVLSIYCIAPIAIGIGAGIGTLCHRFWWGLLIGVVIGFTPLAALFIWAQFE